MRKRLLLISALFCLILLLMSLLTRIPEFAIRKTVHLELGEELKIEDVIKEHVHASLRQDIIAKASLRGKLPQKVGTYTLHFSYQDRHQSIQVIIEDTTPPRFTKTTDTLYTLANDKIDLSAFEASDLSNITVHLDWTPSATPGSYTGEVVAQDAFANRTTHPVTIVVKAPQITMHLPSPILAEGISQKINVQINGDVNDLTYTLTNPQVASIDANGNLTAKHPGTTTITAHYLGTEATCSLTVIEKETSPSAYVLIKAYIPDLYVDLKYATEDNFTHEKIYDFQDAYLRYGTVKKLMAVQEDLKKEGYALLIWDAYRPFEAQKKLFEVVSDPRYVADPANGPRSHNLGITVDASLVTLEGESVSMPSHFDDFSAKADRHYEDIADPQAIYCARLLENTMQKHGMRGYRLEWWDYSDTQSYAYIDFQIPKTEQP